MNKSTERSLLTTRWRDSSTLPAIQKQHTPAKALFIFFGFLAILLSGTPVSASFPVNCTDNGNGTWTYSLPANALTDGCLSRPDPYYATAYSCTDEVGGWSEPGIEVDTYDNYGSPSSSPNSLYSIDPVNLATGNYYYEHQDLSPSGPGLSLAVTRSYNSMSPVSGPFGTSWTFTYNVKMASIYGSEIVLVMWEDGHADIYNPGPNNTYSPPLGVSDHLTWNTNGTFTIARKNNMTYQFTATGKLKNIADSNGNTIHLTYTGSNLTHVADSSGRGLTFIYNAAGRIISIADPSGTMRYTYDGDDNLVRFSNSTGGEISYTYDDNHRMTSVTSPDGIRVLNNTYDENGRVIRQNWPPDNVNTFEYDADNRMTTLTYPSGRKTVYTFDERGWELSETDDIGNTISYAYDDNGNRIDTTDTIGNFIRSACYIAGEIIRSLFE